MAAITIDPRFTGPADSANGGVTCGLLAGATGRNEVTLRRPPPLGRPLEVRDGSLYDGAELVASSADAEVTVEPRGPVPLAEAALATASYVGWRDHPYPTCFVCGPENEQGLRVFPGPVGDDLVAAPWVPVDDDPVMVWAALDCPSGWASDLPGRRLLLGRMGLRVDRAPAPGEDHVVLGWVAAEEGRKVMTGSALWTADGDLLAVAQQTWVAVSA